jgi:hypothetical protein
MNSTVFWPSIQHSFICLCLGLFLWPLIIAFRLGGPRRRMTGHLPNHSHGLLPHLFGQVGPCVNNGHQVGIDWGRIARKCAGFCGTFFCIPIVFRRNRDIFASCPGIFLEGVRGQGIGRNSQNMAILFVAEPFISSCRMNFFDSHRISMSTH